MGYAERRGQGANTYYLARHSDGRGRWPTVKGEAGRAIRYRTKRAAEKAADDEEAKVRGGGWADPTAGGEKFGDYANRWYGRQQLAPSTMQNLKHHLEEHLLPAFEDSALDEIDRDAISDWEKSEQAAGYKPSSIATWRTTLHTMLSDAVEDNLIPANPAVRRRGRGRRTGRKANRGPEKVITNPLGALLLAERAAVLSGRDDEFVMLTLAFYTGMRWAELIGLETKYARLGSIRVEWQLWEDDEGIFHRLPPRMDSYRDIDLPPWLSMLISGHVSRTRPQQCECHGVTHVFRGRASGSAATLADVARRAKVSVGTVSSVLHHPDRVTAKTKAEVQAAVTALKYEPNSPGRPGVHWRRSNFGDYVFEPAATGWFPKKSPRPRRPVPLLAEPWPGTRARGRGAPERAEIAWLPVAAGLTPHGLRHSHKSRMAGVRTPEILSHERMGHELGGIGGRYTHVTPGMREELLEQLTEEWEQSLDARTALHPRSPVAVLDGLLQAHARGKAKDDFQDRPTRLPQGKVVALRSRPQDRA